jgi:hypothetical protein
MKKFPSDQAVRPVRASAFPQALSYESTKEKAQFIASPAGRSQ